MIVVDANVIIYLIRESPFTGLAREVYARDPDWVVPELWEAEVLNGLLREARAGALTSADARQAVAQATALLDGRTRKCDRTAVLDTAEETGLTVYDAYYVSLARALGVVLVTQDAKILQRCRGDVARSLTDFLGPARGPSVVRESSAGYRVRRKRRS